MFNHHSLIPWGSFRGRQEEKWGSFRGWDHVGVNLGIISGLRIISGSGSFRGLHRSKISQRCTKTAVRSWKENKQGSAPGTQNTQSDSIKVKLFIT